MESSQIFNLIRSLLDDPLADWTHNDYLEPFFNLACRNLQMELGAYGLVEDVSEIILPNLPAGTTSLASFTNPGQPLATMWQPLELFERPVGADDTAWQILRQVSTIPSLPPQPAFGFWEYRAGEIVLPPNAQPLDLRVRFESLLPIVSEPYQPLRLVGSSHILAYAAAALVARSRGNENLALSHAAEAQRQCQLLLLHLNRNRQMLSIRPRPFRENYAQYSRLIS